MMPSAEYDMIWDQLIEERRKVEVLTQMLLAAGVKKELLDRALESPDPVR